jgi:hypothetical protein
MSEKERKAKRGREKKEKREKKNWRPITDSADVERYRALCSRLGRGRRGIASMVVVYKVKNDHDSFPFGIKVYILTTNPCYL